MGKAIWIVGEPGVGKTTAVRELLEKDSYFIEKPKWTCGMFDEVCAAGHYKGETFDGADCVPYNGVKAALDFWEAELVRYAVTLFDGDRFSNAAVVARLAPLADCQCVLFQAPSEIVAKRREERGSNQSTAWLRGRVTKSRRFFESFDEGKRLLIDASVPRDEVVEILRRFI